LKALLASRLCQTILVLGMTTTLVTPCSFGQTESVATSAKPALCTPAPAPGIPVPPSTLAPLPPFPVKERTVSSISLGISAQLTLDRIEYMPNNGFTEVGADPSAGLLSTFRQTFGPWLGYSVNFGYGRVSERFINEVKDPSDENGESDIGTNMYEYSISYIAHSRLNKRVSLFGDVGLGGLTFQPTQQQYNLYPATQNLPTGVFGAGADLRLPGHFAFRAEYRGLFYKSPHLFSYDEPLTLTSEPTISLVYHLQ
jgi:hypothetical protein